MSADPASFRDPAGRVYRRNGRIFRTVSATAAADFDFAHTNDALRQLVSEGAVIASHDVAANDADAPDERAARIVEHPKLPFVSYPYEWSFPLLKRAALHHLDLQIALLPSGVSLSDATAYNVQFVGVRPVFIDALSFQRYEEGAYWAGHGQFCRQFLNPLLLRALTGVPHNDWFRGSLEGVPTEMLSRLIPFSNRFSWRLLTHVLLPARLQASGADEASAKKAAARPLPQFAYLGMLRQLRDWIAGLQPKGVRKSVWSDYADNNSYAGQEAEAKQRIIGEFAARVKPRLMWDLGCNTGAYSEVALENGAQSVVGFDFDQGALEGAYRRAADRNLAFLPLFQDAANPSPGQGWSGEERAGLAARSADAEALIALAFVHHIAIGRNVPLDRFSDWLTGLAPQGVVEFVPKEDPMVGRLLALRKDIFPDYTLENFKSQIARSARIVTAETITKSGRVLIVYDKSRS